MKIDFKWVLASFLRVMTYLYITFFDMRYRRWIRFWTPPNGEVRLHRWFVWHMFHSLWINIKYVLAVTDFLIDWVGIRWLIHLRHELLHYWQYCLRQTIFLAYKETLNLKIINSYISLCVYSPGKQYSHWWHWSNFECLHLFFRRRTLVTLSIHLFFSSHT